MKPPTSPRSSGKMRSARQRPTSRHGTATTRTLAAARPPQKIFNCIVDESALVAGVMIEKDGICQWVKRGQIRLFVPLHALEQLRRQNNNSTAQGANVRKTLHWLDDATSRYPDVVALQGADETYETWPEVERFAVPRTLFSENDAVHEFDLESDSEPEGVTRDDLQRLSLDDNGPKTPVSSVASNTGHSLSPLSIRSQLSVHSVISPPTSPSKPVLSPAPKASSMATLEHRGSFVPKQLQPLFNYILWRIHQELDPAAALESFIFLCNDEKKVNYAKGFDIKTKRLEQLREAIAREKPNPSPPTSPQAERLFVEEDDSAMLRSPPQAPAAIVTTPAVPPTTKIFDPNAFGRDLPQTGSIPFADVAPHSPRQRNAIPNQSVRGGGTPNNYSSRASTRGHHRGGSRGRGSGNGRGGFSNANSENDKRKSGRVETVQLAGQIDPDSFARPRGGGFTGRGGRKLWTPS